MCCFLEKNISFIKRIVLSSGIKDLSKLSQLSSWVDQTELAHVSVELDLSFSRAQAWSSKLELSNGSIDPGLMFATFFLVRLHPYLFPFFFLFEFLTCLEHATSWPLSTFQVPHMAQAVIPTNSKVVCISILLLVKYLIFWCIISYQAVATPLSLKVEWSLKVHYAFKKIVLKYQHFFNYMLKSYISSALPKHAY